MYVTMYSHLLDEDKEFDDIDECLDDMLEKAQVDNMCSYRELDEQQKEYRKAFYKLLKEKMITSYEKFVEDKDSGYWEEVDRRIQDYRERYLFD